VAGFNHAAVDVGAIELEQWAHGDDRPATRRAFRIERRRAAAKIENPLRRQLIVKSEERRVFPFMAAPGQNVSSLNLSVITRPAWSLPRLAAP